MAGASPQATATPQAPGTLPQGAQEEEDKSVYSYREIAHLVLIKANPHFQTALEEWERKEKDLGIRVDRREKRSADLKNEIYNIVGWFAVFQGVVLTAVAQLAANQTSGSTPLCGKIWSPILLTLFGTIVTCVGVLHKFAALRELELSIQTEKQAQAEVARRGLTLRRKGPERFCFKTDTRNAKKRKKPKTFWINWFFVFLPLLFFTALFVLSYSVILCDVGVIRGWNNQSKSPEMPKTTVINGTTKPLTLKEGTAGIFTLLKKLQPGESYQIVVDTNATYREYWCAAKPDDPDGAVVLSSDDCEDLKEVTITEKVTGSTTSYSYKGVNRESGETTTEEAKIREETSNCESETTTDEVGTTRHGGPFTWLRSIFRKPEKGSSSRSQV